MTHISGCPSEGVALLRDPEPEGKQMGVKPNVNCAPNGSMTQVGGM